MSGGQGPRRRDYFIISPINPMNPPSPDDMKKMASALRVLDDLRHSRKTWSSEDGIPEILAEQRLGHQVPGMRGLYAHASERMRDDLTKVLQARWEESLRHGSAPP